jgi:hypothetical protein
MGKKAPPKPPRHGLTLLLLLLLLRWGFFSFFFLFFFFLSSFSRPRFLCLEVEEAEAMEAAPGPLTRPSKSSSLSR